MLIAHRTRFPVLIVYRARLPVPIVNRVRVPALIAHRARFSFLFMYAHLFILFSLRLFYFQAIHIGQLRCAVLFSE